MEENLVMGHFKWLLMFVICFSVRNANCDPSINMKEIVTGVRGFSVDIPCTYTPSKDYEEVEVEWFLYQKVIIHRIDSQDHIPLVEFRERVKISKSPGDVSLSISKLSSGDKGDVKCKVTWKKNDGTKISKEEITKLKILRTNSDTSVDFITTGKPNIKTMKPITEKPKVNILTTYQELETTPITEQHDATILPEVTTVKPTTEKSIENIPTTTNQEHKTTIPNTKKHDDSISSEVTSGISHFGTVSTMEITKLTTNMKVRKSTTVTPLYTTELFNTHAAQKKGFGIPLYMLVVIIICVLCITTLTLVLIIKKKKKNIYDLPTMNQLLALEGARNECQSCTDETTASNVYESSNLPPVSVYEGIVLPFSNEYDLLISEKTPENDSPMGQQ